MNAPTPELPSTTQGGAPFAELIPHVERIHRALAHLHFAEGVRQDGATRITRYETATGFLVRLGGRDFVYTAKHNLEGETASSVGVQIPRTLVVPCRIPQGAHKLLHAEGDIDAAVIELDPRMRGLWQSAQPFEGQELGLISEANSARTLCLAGFPVAAAKIDGAVPGMDLMGAFGAVMLLVRQAVGHRSDREPSEGRGIHVHYGGSAYNHGLKRWVQTSPPKGISGGPLAAIGNEGVRVLGLARSIDDNVEWCEPAIECTRLLMQHEDAKVAAEAGAIIRRAAEG
jgi:hypothetical protein